MVSRCERLPQKITFERAYGGSKEDWCTSALMTSDGGYLLTGWTFSFGQGLDDIYLVKVDSLGDTLWTRTYGDSLRNVAESMQETKDRGYILAGWRKSLKPENADVYLLKIAPDGETLWSRTYGGPDTDWARFVQETRDGGFIVIGRTRSFGHGMADIYLLRTDSLGDTLWTKTYGDSSQEWGYSVQETQEGGYILTGQTTSFGSGLQDVYLIRTDSSGETLWTKTYGDTSAEGSFSIQKTLDGGYVIIGYTFSFGAGNQDIYLIRTDSRGDTLWTRTYGGARNEIAYSILQTEDGGYIIGGQTFSFASGGEGDAYLIKTDSKGETLWTRTFGGPGTELLTSVQVTSDGGYLLGGWTESYGAGGRDFYLLKTDEEGRIGEKGRK